MMKFVKNNRFLLNIYQGVSFLVHTRISVEDGSRKKYPLVIQLPITYRCNSRCVMCDIWKMDHSNEVSLQEFRKIISDPIFNKIRSVGINGGEPSLMPDLQDYAKVILKLPHLKNMNIISNGVNQRQLLKSLEVIYKCCCVKKVHFHVSVSLDGYGSVHDLVRGIKGSFQKTVSTIDEIMRNRNKYCDTFDIGCTIVSQNVHYLMELDAFAKKKEYKIKYRLGVANQRIGSDRILDQFSVLNNHDRQAAMEFIHYQLSNTQTWREKFKYYAILKWLGEKNKTRILGCIWKEQGITLDSRGKIYYCAVASKSLGSLNENEGKRLFWGDQNIAYRREIVKNRCNRCIHDYYGKPRFTDALGFLFDRMHQKITMKLFLLKARFI